MKLGIVMHLASVVANVAPVQHDLVVVVIVDDIDGAQDRQTRSYDSYTGGFGIPWYVP